MKKRRGSRTADRKKSNYNGLPANLGQPDQKLLSKCGLSRVSYRASLVAQ